MGQVSMMETELEAPCSQLKSVQDGEEGNHGDDNQRKITKFSEFDPFETKEVVTAA